MFKKFLAIILTFVMAFGAVSFVNADTEIPEGYTPIYTAEDLNNIRNDLDGKYVLMNDIDLSVYENWEPIGTAEAPFTGELNGNGYCVKNLTISVDLGESANYYYGLFGYIKNSKINNILAVDCGIKVSYSGTETARCNLGTIAGCGYMSEITDCAASGKITIGNFLTTVVGGILGRDDMLCTLERCSNYSDIIAEATALSKYVYVGGISGVAMGNKNECCNFGEIKAEGKDFLSECKVMVGGIDGSGYEASALTDCYNRGDISIGVSTSNTFVGGISGTSFVTKNAYNTGKIILPDDFNGYSGSISGNIGTGGASIPVVGMPAPYIENVYYSESDLPVGYAECLHPDDYYEDKYDSVYKSFAELSDDKLKKQELFVGFDFENTWEMEENGYPILQNQPVFSKIEPGNDSSTDVSTELTTDISDKECPFGNLWIIKALEWLLSSAWKVVISIVGLF